MDAKTRAKSACFIAWMSVWIVSASSPASADAGPDPVDSVAEPVDPAAILDGGTVPACAWPAAGAFYIDKGGDWEVCGAVYVGGRAIVTAAHCVQPGYALEPMCEDDADCPDLSSEIGNVLDLTCEEHPIVPDRKHCRDDAHPTIGNNPSYVRFGTWYPEIYADGELRKGVQVAYCKVFNPNWSPGGDGDFAYCVLTEKPNLQAVPMIMQCEVDAELDVGTELVAAGFGECIGNDPGSTGTKRSASTTLEAAISSTDDDFGIATLDWTSVSDGCAEVPGGGADETGAGGDDGSSGGPWEGDSGSGMYAKLSDGTWRLIGVGSTSAVYTAVWPYVEWMIMDPNISASDIRPCHDSSGQWTGGLSCKSVPTAPDMASGQWRGGARASCYSTALALRTDLCSAPVKVTPEQVYGDRAAASVGAADERSVAAGASTSGCRSAAAPPPTWMLVLLPLIPVLRRRKEVA